jgi:hypothetical protein
MRPSHVPGGRWGVIYILSANQYGGHFFNGYTWNARASGGLGNGGWEYILLLIIFFGSFSISGAGKFSIGAPWLNWHTLRRTHCTLFQQADRCAVRRPNSDIQDVDHAGGLPNFCQPFPDLRASTHGTNGLLVRGRRQHCGFFNRGSTGRASVIKTRTRMGPATRL